MKKKIGISIAFGVLVLIAVAIIVMVSITVNYKPEIANPYKITIANQDNKSITLTEELHQELYNDILEEFEKSYSRSFLSALFAGQVGNDAKAVLIDSNKIDTFTQYKITFSYTSEQSLTVQNETKEKTYNKIEFAVEDSESFENSKIYFKVSENYYYELSTMSNQQSFFKFLEGIEDYK